MAAKNTGNAGKGRPKGSKNKLTALAKESFEAVYMGIGGDKRFIEWVQANERNLSAFYTAIYPKLLPIQATTPQASVDYEDLMRQASGKMD